MDVKRAFLNGKISKEVYVEQPTGFESSKYPNHVCKLNKALYGLKQAPRAWYETLSKFLTQHKFVRGFQIKQDSRRISICQEKYVKDLLKKYDLADCASVKCPMLPPNNLGPDESGVSVNETQYQANPKESHLVAVKRIFRKSTSGGCQILGGKLVCWSAKKQTSVAMSSAEAEYVAAAGCCAQVLWIKSQLADYDVLCDKVLIFCDNTSAIAISNNRVLHSRTKHIDIRYHFIRDHILKGDIELHFVPTNLQLADIFTKPLAEPSFTRLVAELDCIIQFNNGVALLKSDHPSYKKLFEFLKKSHISVALTKEPSAYYSQFLREFWYTVEADISSKSITFMKALLIYQKKETVKEGLATLGLFDETKPSLTSFDLINSSPVKVKYFTPMWKVLMQYIVKCLGEVQGSHDQLNLNQQIIAYSLCWGLNIDITGILFSDLIAQLHPETGKHERKLNICYTRYLSLVMEHLMKENYKNDKLLSLKPYKITSVTLRTPLENETPLTAHMCNVAEISPPPLQSLIPPSREVNADDSADKSLSGTFVQPVTQPKATTDRKPRKKTIPSSTRPEALNLSRIETSSSS
ncbi:retrovirus-related pol polyprotein from transposon TNT 1-94, partial [Tanacetum coccineum]